MVQALCAFSVGVLSRSDQYLFAEGSPPTSAQFQLELVDFIFANYITIVNK